LVAEASKKLFDEGLYFVFVLEDPEVGTRNYRFLVKLGTHDPRTEALLALEHHHISRRYESSLSHAQASAWRSSRRSAAWLMRKLPPTKRERVVLASYSCPRLFFEDLAF
jgi:hypothetical protein